MADVLRFDVPCICPIVRQAEGNEAQVEAWSSYDSDDDDDDKRMEEILLTLMICLPLRCGAGRVELKSRFTPGLDLALDP